MPENVLSEIYKILPEEKVLLNEPMKNHTSFKIGGPAEVFIKVATENEMKNIITIAEKDKAVIVWSVEEVK